MVNRVALKPITADEVAEREAIEGVGREIINGRWAEETEMPTIEHNDICVKLILLLAPFVQRHELGKVHTDQMNYVLEGTKDNIIKMRIPDVSFVRMENAFSADKDGYYYLAPDLAIEVVSASESAADVAAKVEDYLRYGTRQVWVIYPTVRQIVVHFADGTSQTYGMGDALTGGDVLPGFELPVAAILG